MKTIFLIALCFIVWSCSDHAKVDFLITETIIDKVHLDSLRNELIQQRDSIIFEDSIYTVRSSCHGEWGGSIWFTNKKTGIEYASAATCPVVVNNLQSKYIVTATLAHGSGFSEIIEIQNPELMEVFELPEPREVKEDGTPSYYVTDLESHSKEGTVSLVDTTGILTLSSFKYQNELYHITTDFKSTFISSVVNGRFKHIETVSNKSIWTYDPKVVIVENNHFLTFFSNDEAKGYIDIWDNKIELRLIE